MTIDGDIAETVQSYRFVAFKDAAWNMGWYFRTMARTTDGWKIDHTKVKMQKIAPGPRRCSRSPNRSDPDTAR